MKTNPKKLTLEEKQQINLEKHKKRLESKKEMLANRSESKFYCKNKDLMAELDRWHESGFYPDTSKISMELYKMISKIAHGLANHSNFIHYPWHLKETMIEYAVSKTIVGLPNYNFKFKNPFAYITQSCYNSFLIEIRKYYKQNNIKRELVKQKLTQLESMKEFRNKNLYSDFLKQYLGETDKD
jgi:hypothetical protein